MTENQQLLEKLEKLLKWKKSKAYYAEKLGVSVETVEELLKELNGEADEQIQQTGHIIKVSNEKGILESHIEVDYAPKDDLELAKLHKIDLNKYKISNYWSKLKPNGKFTSSVFAVSRKGSEYSQEEFKKFLENYNPQFTANILKTTTQGKEEIDVEISIADFHLAKKTVDNESLNSRKELFLDAAESLINKVKACFNVNKIVFPISNDFFHTDNYQNQTTNGTPQDVLTTFDHEYEEGFDILASVIYLFSNAGTEVEVILVQGNHDRTKSFYVAHALEVFFRNNKKVSFQRKHSTTKFTVLGNTFIGYHHGNCKIDELPLLFATSQESAPHFGYANYREVHTGDKHHYMAKEVKGVRIQQMPSLSGTDRWHLDNNYVNSIRAALALVYHPIDGKVAEFEYRIKI